MFITNNTLAELIFYLNNLKTLLKSDNLNKQIFSDGTTVGHIAYHAAESANYWLTVFILNKEFPRDRDKAFTQKHTLKEIIILIDSAISLRSEIVNRRIALDTPLKQKRLIKSMGIEVTNVHEVLQHVTAHTANHLGQINGKIS